MTRGLTHVEDSMMENARAKHHASWRRPATAQFARFALLGAWLLFAMVVAFPCLRLLANQPGQVYRGNGVQFSYPQGWTLDERIQVGDPYLAGRFTFIGITAPDNNAAAGLFLRTDSEGRSGDHEAMSIAFRTERCGPKDSLLGRAALSPLMPGYLTQGGLILQPFATRNLNHNVECLEVVISTDPPGDRSVKEESRRNRQHMAARYAVLLYVLTSSRPTQNDGPTTRISGGMDYLKSIAPLNLILSTFRFQ
jgi:hypothetical protein